MANNLNTPWARLTQREKAELIGLYTRYGYNDLAGIINDYNEFANGGKIHIKESKRGTFTAAAKSRGMGVQEFASKVLANKDNYSAAMVKKANFARNAAKWHDDGGQLKQNGNITSSIKTEYLPDISTNEGKTLAKRMAYNVLSGNMDIQNVPRKYYSYVDGEIRGAQPMRDAINSEGVKTAIGTVSLPLSIIAGAEAAPLIASTASSTVPHALSVLANPVAANTTAGALTATALDAYGLASGLRGLSDDTNRVINRNYSFSDIPYTLMNATALIPGSSNLTSLKNLSVAKDQASTAGSIAKTIITDFPGIKKRAAEVILRMGDNAYIPIRSFSKESINNAGKFIFNPKYKNSGIEYNLGHGFNYSGEAIIDSFGVHPHYGDVVDQYLGKAPIPNAQFDRNILPKGIRSYVDTYYPDKNIPIRDIGRVTSDGQLLKFDTGNDSRKVFHLLPGQTVTVGGSSGGIKDLFGNSIVDPGGFRRTATREGNTLLFDDWDIWKFNSKDYSQRYDIHSALQRLGLKFLDKQGTPIIHHWSSSVDIPEDSPFFIKDFSKITNQRATGGPLDLLKKAFAKNYDTDTFSEAFANARNDNKDYFKWKGNRYNTKLDTEVFRESNPSNLQEGYAIQDAMRRIMQVENSKDNKRGGWDEANQRWYPHRSPEGGADTIAYGIKLSNGTPEAALAKKQGYLTDEQALDALDTLVQKYHDNASTVYDKRFGDGSWDKLSEKSKSILTDYEYNPGLKKFPKLMEAFNNGDLEGIKSQYKRYLGKKELARNRYLARDIDSLSTFYPIFK